MMNMLLDSRHRGGQLQNLEDREGYGFEERLWVASFDIQNPGLIEDLMTKTPPSSKTSMGTRIVAAPRRREDFYYHTNRKCSSSNNNKLLLL